MSNRKAMDHVMRTYSTQQLHVLIAIDKDPKKNYTSALATRLNVSVSRMYEKLKTLKRGEHPTVQRYSPTTYGGSWELTPLGESLVRKMKRQGYLRMSKPSVWARILEANEEGVALRLTCEEVALVATLRIIQHEAEQTETVKEPLP